MTSESKDAVVHKFDEMSVEQFGDGITRRYVRLDTVAQSWIEMKKGFFSPFHRHEDEQTVILMKGKLRARSGPKGQEKYTEMNPGDILLIPSNVIHQVEALEDSVFSEAWGPGPNLKEGIKPNKPREQQEEKEEADTVSITYVEHSGKERELKVKTGMTLMEAATENDVEGIIGECGGTCSCATCHVIVDEAWFGRIDEPADMERELVEALPLTTKTSRLGCQIEVSKALDGLVVRVPEEQF